MKDELTEAVAKAICEADGKEWQSGIYRVATGKEFEYEEHSADALNNKYRYIAKFAVMAMGKYLAENAKYTPTHD